MISLLLATQMLLASSPSQPPHGIYGTFSKYDVDRMGETGDATGFEIVILPGFDHPNVVFQCAVGWFGEVVLVPAKVFSDRITFDIPQPNLCAGNFTAVPAAKGIRLTGDTLKPAQLLPRSKSFWAPRAPSQSPRSK